MISPCWWIYEESLKENVVEYADQKRSIQVLGTSAGGVGPAKQMVVGSFLPQRSQGCTSNTPQCLQQKNQASKQCHECNRVH
jgi:hypothetical protein